MKDNEILEGNRLIAKFLGLKRGFWVSVEKPVTDDKKQWCDFNGKTFLGTRVYYDNTLLFHQSWDWLMPVVQKIEAMDISFTIDRNVVNVIGHGYEWRSGTTSDSKIISTWYAVTEFIKYYNN